MNRDIWFAEQPLFKLDSTKFLWNLFVSSPSGGEAFGAVRHGLQYLSRVLSERILLGCSTKADRGMHLTYHRSIHVVRIENVRPLKPNTRRRSRRVLGWKI